MTSHLIPGTTERFFAVGRTVKRITYSFVVSRLATIASVEDYHTCRDAHDANVFALSMNESSERIGTLHADSYPWSWSK